MTTLYLLMNKDKKIATISCRRNAYDEPIFELDAWHSELRPIGFTDMTAFIESRRAPKHRAHIEELLRQYGCSDLEGFVRVTHALSLNDTLWVCDADSPLRWAEVSLYRNPFSEMIGRTAFEGTLSDVDMSSTSPEFGTSGAYAKCWKREGDEILLYKAGSPQLEIEPLSEYLAAQLAELLCPMYVSYDLDRYHGRLISKCPLFTSERIGFVSASRVLGRRASVSELLATYEKHGAGDAFRRMCVLDALILNTDRHFGNFGFLFDNDTLELLGAAPVFDHNQSLFPHVDDSRLAELDWYARRAEPRFGADLNATANALLTDEIRADLKNLSGFTFSQHPRIKAPQERLEALSRFVNRQIENVLSRTLLRAKVLDAPGKRHEADRTR